MKKIDDAAVATQQLNGDTIDSQLVELLGCDDDGVLAGQRHQAAVMVPERVLHARDLRGRK